MLQSPAFWKVNSLQAKVLWPLSQIYQMGYRVRRMSIKPIAITSKILCIGNLIAGGAGKTPVALDVGQYIKSQGVNACYLSKGYGGTLRTPTLVNPQIHNAKQTGDEALLLAQVLPTIVAKSRVAGAKFAEKQGFDLIILDDGFQNPTLKPDISLVVVDSVYRFGNGFTLPAGPLREPVKYGLSRADALVVLRRDRKQGSPVTDFPIPVINADLRTSCPEITPDKKLIAFTGIARPEQFFEALVQHCGAHIVSSFPFADHHPFTKKDMVGLKTEANKHDATLITTAKDAARLPEEQRGEVMVAQATINWHNADDLKAVLAPLLASEEKQI
ncbi:MAG: tetraacyldisaccharide 4'-kinase [Alphaproteobacteria bacterium]|nr:tetraacyldisaccharide 4'-kinase [Alphaproteobacteria bacterium]